MFRKTTMILLALVDLAATARADVAKGDACAPGNCTSKAGNNAVSPQLWA